jgi:DNA-binding NarL/FixJ family response regulator
MALMLETIALTAACTLATRATGSLYDVVAAAFRDYPQAAEALEAADGAAPNSREVKVLAQRLSDVAILDESFDAKVTQEMARFSYSRRIEHHTEWGQTFE